MESDLLKGWISHNGGECPIKDQNTVFAMKFRSGGQYVTTLNSNPHWDHRENAGDIIAYRIIEAHGDDQMMQLPFATKTRDGRDAIVYHYAQGQNYCWLGVHQDGDGEWKSEKWWKCGGYYNSNVTHFRDITPPPLPKHKLVVKPFTNYNTADGNGVVSTTSHCSSGNIWGVVHDTQCDTFHVSRWDSEGRNVNGSKWHLTEEIVE